MSEAHVQEELLAYLDGELDAAARIRVEAHLERCRECAAELQALRELRYGLDVTLDAALSSVRLSREADDRIREVLLNRLARAERAAGGNRAGAAGGVGGWLRGVWSGRLRLAQAALALMVIFFSLSTSLALNVQAPIRAHEVLVLGEPRLAPGSRGALRVIVRDAGGEGAAGAAAPPPVGISGAMVGSPVGGVSVAISLLTESGLSAPLFAGATDALGTVNAVFDVPDVPEGAAELVVETSSATGASRLTQEIAIARAYKIYVMSDKPAYRPGQTIGLRGLVLDATDLRPVTEGDLTWTIRDPAGAVVEQTSATLSSYGVATWMYQLPMELPEGDYQIVAAVGATRSERTVRVEAYDLPAFRVDLAPEQSYLVPGERLAGRVTATYFFGMPVIAGTVLVHGTVPGRGDQFVVEVTGLTDAEGTFAFEAELPNNLLQGDLVLTAEVVDPTGRGAGVRQVLPVSASPLLVKAVPESGVLRTGVENVIVVMTTTPDGRPAAADLAVTVDGTTQLLSTDRYGLASLAIIPTGDTDLDVVARDAQGAEARTTLALDGDGSGTVLLLHTPQATYDVQDTLVARALISGDAGDTVYLDVLRAGQMVAGLASPVDEGVADFALDLDPSLVGALELRAYAIGPNDVVARDNRLVVVDPAQTLDVAIFSDRARYAPGDLARVTVQTTSPLSASQPVPAALGIAVVDDSVYALDRLPPSFARTYMLINDQMLARREAVTALDLPALLAQEGEARQGQDLAAGAAWAGAADSQATIQARQVVVAPDDAAILRQRALNRLVMPLITLPALALALVVGYLRREQLTRRILTRMAVTGLVLFLLAPILLAGVVLGFLLPILGAALFFITLLIAVVLIVVILVHSLRRRREQLQLFVLIVIGHLVLSGWMLTLTAFGADLGGWRLFAIVGGYLLLVMATLLEGQTLLLQSTPVVGWSAVILALILAVLAVTAPTVPALRSNVSTALGNPTLYVGPLGWLSGCAPVGTGAPEPAGTVVSETAEEPEAPVPTPAPTALPAPTASPVPLDLPLEPYPLRQIFPETLYWEPEVATDEQGTLTFDLALADSLTTWRVTVLASTLDGTIGAGTLPLVVSQDLILDVVAPEHMAMGEIVTLTLNVYNTTAAAQSIRWLLPTIDAMVEVVVPEPLVVPAQSGVSVDWVIRPAVVGAVPLEVGVMSERGGDRVLVTLQVVP